MNINEVAIIAVSGFTAVMILTTIGIMIILIIKAARGDRPRRSKGDDADETKLIQEIYHGMSKMAERVETLETLLLDEDRAKREDFERKLRNG